MKNTFNKLAIVAALSAATSVAFADSANVQADVTIGDDLSLTQGQALSFGTIIPNGANDTVSIGPTGTVTAGDTTALGSPQAGQFTISGTNGATVNINYQAPGTFNLTNGGSTITFTPTALPGTCTVGSTCTDLKVYGSIVVGTGNTSGLHQGNVTIEFTH